MIFRMLVTSSLLSRWPLNLLAVLLGALATAAAVCALLLSLHMAQRLSADANGVDLVVGAKGSPLQLVLSSVYHLDVPTGNIPLAEAEKLMHDKAVRTAIPLALGDSWRGLRIVGTSPAYPRHYGAQTAQGRMWAAPFEAVAGADVPLAVGDSFTGSHGLAPGGHSHAENPYRVVGRLTRTHSVIDRLILTSTESVIAIHSHHHHHDDGDEDDHDHNHNHNHDHGHGHGHDEDHGGDHAATAAHPDADRDHTESGHEAPEHEDHAHSAAQDHDPDHAGHHDDDEDEFAHGPEITALLLILRSPAALMTMPRLINRDTGLQAASPALEMARLGALFGFGRKAVYAVAAVFALMAAAAIFAGLAAGLEHRAADIAILRALGYGPGFIFALIAAEGAVLAALGCVFGLAGGAAAVAGLGAVLPPPAPDLAALAASCAPALALVCAGVVLCGVLAALRPALRGARMDIATQLIRD